MAEPTTCSETSSQLTLPIVQQHSQSTQEQLAYSYKNRLQEFANRAKIPCPVYHSVNDGGHPHAPKFRSTVIVDGKTFTSSDTFSNKKAAEQDVAKIAFEGITNRIKDCISSKTNDGVFPPIYEDRVLSKSILHQFTSKMNLGKPTYNTVQLEGLVPHYRSSVDINGVIYTGEPSVYKKEAEQLAARAAILSILGDSGSGTTLSEIVKSKAVFFSVAHKYDSPNVDTGNNNEASASKERVTRDANQAGVVPRHEFRKPGQGEETVPQTIWLPISFVQSLQVSGGKRKCKNKKKKANKKVKDELVNQATPEGNILQAGPGGAM